MALKSVLVSFLIMFLFVSESFAFCYQKVMSTAYRSTDSGMVLGCFDIVPVYTPSTGCSVSSSAMQGCLAVYQICCDDSVTGYETGAPHIDTLTGVDVGSEYEAAKLFYEDMQVNGYAAPACEPGFQSTWETKGMIHKSEPDPSDFTKSKVTVSTFYRQGCDVFSNTSSSSYTPIGSVGGSGGSGGSIDLTSTNDLLNQIKSAIDSAGTKGDNQGVIDAVNNIKALLDVGGVANPSNLLTSIKGVLDGIDLKDGEGNALLTEIRDILQAGGGGFTGYSGGGGSGGTVNIDMTETNGLLSGIADLLTSVKDTVIAAKDSLLSLVSSVSGDSSLGGYVDNTASKPAYSSSFFEAGTPTIDSYKGAFNGFTNDMKATPLFGLVGGFFGGAPTGGSSVVSFNGGVYGTHSYDFSSWSSIMSVIKGIILVMFAAASIKIIFLKGGSG